MSILQLLSINVDDMPWEFAAVAGVSMAKLGGLFFLHKYGRKNWVWCGKVSKLFIYPLKSCRGIEVDEVEVTEDGMKYGPVGDRSWMIISGDGNLVSQRNQENIALIRQSLEDDKLVLTAPGIDPLQLDTNPSLEEGKMREAILFGHPVRVLHCGEEAHRWICQLLGRDDIHIVHLPRDMDNISLEPFNQGQSFYARDGDKKRLHDEAPFMVMSRATVEDVSRRLPADNISVLRFRPNILVDADLPYDEDNWQQLQIGEQNYFTRVGMCSRCIFTTVNPDEPNKAKDSLEPLKTLRTYRLAPADVGYGRSPLLGVHMCPDVTGGFLRQGDDILVVKQHY